MTACQVTCVTRVRLSVTPKQMRAPCEWWKSFAHCLARKEEVLVNVLADIPVPLTRVAHCHILSTSNYLAMPKVDCHAGISIYQPCKLFCWQDLVCKNRRMHKPTRSVLDQQAVSLDSRAHALGKCQADSYCNLLSHFNSVARTTHSHAEHTYKHVDVCQRFISRSKCIFITGRDKVQV